MESALKKAKKQLRAMNPARFGGSQGTGSQVPVSLPPPGPKRPLAQSSGRSCGSQSNDSAPVPKRPRSGTISAVGASTIVVRDVTPPPKRRLEKVPTHLEQQKSLSQVTRMQMQEDLLDCCAIQRETVTG